ncbi:HAD family hydrolase [Streptomyces capitiformicae]|uniref:Hydrolase n=1 Tax=Streptomyces capitiformicae TaxID=2014920 RepID=A0A919DBJ2_9ACTN|nr:HAD family hydrolase [Streptomyces capitiformicae]GHE31868.1 hydrolase [Streptomyces capitiformicae]
MVDNLDDTGEIDDDTGEIDDDTGEIDEAWDMLASARGVLFDFDGPICRLFPDGSSRGVADGLRELVAEHDLSDVLTEQARTDKDPHVVLRTVHGAREGRDLKELVERLETQTTVGELAAAEKASYTRKSHTPDADRLIRLLAGMGARLAVVTNNAESAADCYLRARGLREHFAYIHGRTTNPDLMKPHPDVVLRALRSLTLPAREAVMIGDTPTDVEAAAMAGVRFIGYGRNAEKRTRLRRAGAKVVLGSYAPLLGRAREGGADESRACFVGEGASRGAVG